MKDEYMIISKTLIQQRIEELERLYKYSEKPSIQGTLYNQLSIELKQILSQSTPLIPEIEKAYWDAVNRGQDISSETSDSLIQDYISNLKLDI